MNFGGVPRGTPLWCAWLLFLAQAPPGYTSAMLDGAVFDERVRITLRSQAGGTTRLETVGREARWRVRAEAAAEGVTVEAWYDSLYLWREGPENRLEPDTDGLVGGRYRGTVSAAGRVVLAVRPFVPAEVAEVSDLAEAFATFLPRLPARALAVGSTVEDADGWRMQRRPDSTGADGPLLRFRWQRAAVDTLEQRAADSAPYLVLSTQQEDGHLVWDPRRGPIAWHRDVRTDVEVPADGPVRRAVRTRVEERLQGWRRARAP